MSDANREVLFRFKGEVDPSVRKSLAEIIQLATKTEATRVKVVRERRKEEAKAAREDAREVQESIRRAMKRETYLQDSYKKREQAVQKQVRQQEQAQKALLRDAQKRAKEEQKEVADSIKRAKHREKMLQDAYKKRDAEEKKALREQQRAKAKAEREAALEARQKAKETQNALKQQERAAVQSARAQQQAQQQATRANKQFDKAVMGAAGSIMSLARGLLLMGLAGEENSEKMLRGLLKLEGGFAVIRSGVRLYQQITTAVKAYNAALAASAVAQAATAGTGGVKAAGGTAAAVVGGTAAGAAGGKAAAFSAVGGTAVKGGLAGIAAAIASGAAVILYETLRDAAKYGVGGGASPGSWSGKIADVQASMLTKAAGYLPNSANLRSGIAYGITNNPRSFDPFFDAADRQKRTDRMQNGRSSALEAGHRRAVGAYSDMQVSGVRAGGANAMLALRGGAMPLAQLQGIDPAMRGAAELAYQAPQDVQRAITARRDMEQSQAKLGTIRQAAGMVGAGEEAQRLLKAAEAEVQAKVQGFAEAGMRAVDTFRQLAQATEEFGRQGKATLFNMALQSPATQRKVESALDRVQRGIGSRKDLQRVQGAGIALTEQEKGFYTGMYGNTPNTQRRLAAQQAQMQSQLQNISAKAALDLKLDNAVSVTLNSNPDQLAAELRRVLEPIFAQTMKDNEAMIRQTATEVFERVANQVK